MNRQPVKLMVLGLLLLILIGCGGGDATPTPIVIVVTATPPQDEAITTAVQSPPPGASIEIVEAALAHGLTEEMLPVDPGTDFSPDEAVYLSLHVKGRPTEGSVIARFYWHDSLITEASVDLADIESDPLSSADEDTYLGYTLSHEEPFPISDQYRADVFYNNQFLDSYTFRAVPPPEAIPSQVTQVTLARGADENYDPIDPATAFAPDQAVFLVGDGDLGLSTWLQVGWFVNGQLDEAGTRSFTLEENLPDAGFAFSFLPEGGWPLGEHFVVLIMNDQEVGRYPFTVTTGD